MNRLSLLIVNYNSWSLCAEAIRSFAAHPPFGADGSPMEWEVLVVDNASPMRDAEAEQQVEDLCRQYGGKLIRHEDNSGYSKGMNLAYEHATGDWILVSNPDVRYLPETVNPLLRAMERDPSIGTAAPKGYFDDQRCGLLPPNILPTLRDLVGVTLANLYTGWNQRYSRKRTREAVRTWSAKEDCDLSMLSGCCFLMRRSLIDRIGFFDERFPLYFEDTDLSVRIRKAGFRIVQAEGAELVHYYDRSGQTVQEEKMRRYWTSRVRYFRKHSGLVGSSMVKLAQRLLMSKYGTRRRATNPYESFEDLGSGHGRPVIQLDRSRRFVVEFCLDPKFLLAAGITGEGDRWSPTQSVMDSFGPTTYWFRVIDLDDPDLPLIKVCRYELLFPSVELECSPEADELGKKRLAKWQETV